MTEAPFKIYPANWQQHQASLLEIRLEVFVKEQAVPIELEVDEFDLEALHVIAEDLQHNAIATGRMLNNGHIGRMAVLKAWRNQGIGSAVLGNLINLARQKSIPKVTLNAQCTAERFYQKMGFRPEGEIFDDAGIPHRKMTKSL